MGKRQCILILFMLAICLCCGAQAEPDYVWAPQANGLRFFEENGKTGVLAEDGSVLFEPVYDGATYFDSYGFARVFCLEDGNIEKRKTGIISETGEVIIPPDKYSYIIFCPPACDDGKGFFLGYYTSLGFDNIRLSRGQTIYTVTGDEIITLPYVIVEQSGTGIFVTDPKGTIHLFQENGESYDEEIESIKLSKGESRTDQYEYASHNYGERYIGYIRTNSGHKVVNDKGIIIREYEEDADGTEKLVRAYTEDGALFLEGIYDDIDYTKADGIYAIKKDGLWGIIREDKSIIVPEEYTEIIPKKTASGQVFLCVKDGKTALIADSGEVLIQPEWDEIYINYGYIRVKKDGKMGVIDSQGNIVIKPEWDWIASFDERPWASEWYYDNLQMKGKNVEVIPTRIGWFFIGKDGKTGVISDEDKIMIEPVWDEIGCMGNDEQGKMTFCARLDWKGYILSSDGQIIEEPEHPYSIMVSHDGTLRLAEEYERVVGENEYDVSFDAYSWTMFDNQTNRLIWSRTKDEISFPIFGCFSDSYNGINTCNMLEDVEYQGEMGFIQPDGTIITNKEWDQIYRTFSICGLAFVDTKDGKMGIINTKGEYVFPPVLDLGPSNPSGFDDFFRVKDSWYAQVRMEDEDENLYTGYVNDQGELISGLKMEELIK